ncbi:hypothetical protein AVO41_01845 [Thiomicrospira sp. WB1]|nr:hypothetical protein AVO41_01845 [Thiomicrospira sp. WB1]
MSLSAVLSLIFLGVFLFFWGQKVLTNHVTDASVSNSKAMMVGLQALMKKGADSEELQKLVREMNQSFSQMDIQLATTDFKKLDSVEVVRSEQNMTVHYPVKVEKQCIACHTEETVGSQKALITHQFPLSKVVFSLTDVMVLLVTFTLISFLIMFALTFLYLRFWVISPLKDLSHFIDQINSHDELDYLSKRTNIYEIERIRHAFNRLGKALSDSYGKTVQAAHFDALTGVGNRRKMLDELVEELKQARESGSPFTIFLMDLNQFKPINDQYGHDVGDAALVHFATLLKTHFSERGQLFRMGGDEFLLVLNNTDQTNVPNIKKQVHDLLSEHPLEEGAFKQTLQTSIGSATYPDNATDVDALIKHADMAMLKDKNGLAEA